jgi:hypothetical protein
MMIDDAMLKDGMHVGRLHTNQSNQPQQPQQQQQQQQQQRLSELL